MDAYVYQYSVGLVFFSAGLIVAARHGYVGLSGPALRNLLLLCGVVLAFFVFRGTLQYGSMAVAEAVPYSCDLVAHRGHGQLWVVVLRLY